MNTNARTRADATLPESGRDAVGLLRRMLLIRHAEERLAKSHQRGLVHGACHTYVGQEAVAVGVCAYLAREEDRKSVV